MEKKNVILLTVIAVATLLITVVGATFAYFAATISGTESAEEIKITSAKGLTITYNGGDTIKGSNILPGWGETYATSANEYEVTVSNDNQFDVTYTMKWSAVTNGLNAADQKNLTYDANGVVAWSEPSSHLEQGNTSSALSNVEGQAFPTTDGGVFTTQTLQAGEKITYTIKVAYKYDEKNEQESQGAKFTAKLNIASDDIQVKAHVAA